MELQFSDPFNRADNPIGNDWVSVYSTFNINSGVVVPASGFGAKAHRNTPTLTADQLAYIDMFSAAGNTFDGYIWCRGNSGHTDYYQLTWHAGNTAGASSYYLQRVVSGTPTTIATVAPAGDKTSTHSVGIQCVGSSIGIYVDGEILATVTDTAITSGAYYGFGEDNSAAKFDNFFAYDQAVGHLSVDPLSVLPSAIGVTLTLTSDRANWTPGTPGTPEFTVSDGTITDQTVDTTGVATLTYTSSVEAGYVTITDPLNSDTCQLQVLGNPVVDYTEVLRRLGEYDAGDSIANFWQGLTGKFGTLGEYLPNTDLWSDLDTLVIDWEADTPIGTIRTDIYEKFVANQAPASDVLGILTHMTAYEEIIRNLCKLSYEILYGLTLNSPTSLEGLRNELTGNTTTTLYDILTAISAPDLSAITDQLDEIQTVNDWNLGSVQTWVNAIRTVSNWTLGDVLTAISNVRGTGAPDLAQLLTAINGIDFDDTDILNAITAVRGSGNPDLAAVLTAIANVRGLGAPDLKTINDNVLSIPTNPITSLEPILDQMATDKQDILNAIAAVAPVWQGAPVYPGDQAVSHGTPIALTEGDLIEGPFHGLQIDVTAVKPGTGQWGVDDFLSYKYGGYVWFLDDTDHAEAVQYLGPSGGLLAPRSMRIASAAIVYLGSITAATITPWTIDA